MLFQCKSRFHMGTILKDNPYILSSSRSWVQAQVGLNQRLRYYFSAKLLSTQQDGSTRNQNNVPGWRHMSTKGVLFQSASTIKIKLSVLV